MYRYKGLRGDSQAVLYLGQQYASEGNETKAFAIILKSAKMGNPEAQFFWGERYISQGRFIESIEWLKESAGQIHVLQYMAHLRLAQIYGLGLGVLKDEVKSLSHLEKCSIALPKCYDYQEILLEIQQNGFEGTLECIWDI